MILSESPTVKKYKDTIKRCIRYYYSDIDENTLDSAIDYSINKRYKQTTVSINNSYTKQSTNKTLLAIADYIESREPIVTAYGTMFKKHTDVPNPLGAVVQSFLDKRSQDKKMMFKYPKGSEMFEKYNLLQSLDKIDANGIYGVLGLYISLLYNINVATSITSQGRSLVSSAAMQFEMFLNNNVKFGSLDEVVQFIDHIVQESNKRTFKDNDWIDTNVSLEDCFAKIILTCGYRWIPEDKDLDIIWKILSNLSQENINRIYYKNNLFEFVSNEKVFNLINKMLHTLKRPLYNSLDIPEEISDDIKLFGDLLMEYVYYDYMIIDRIDRCNNMIRSVVMVLDTDSNIISLDGWYRFISEKISGEKYRIMNFVKDPIIFTDENGKKIEKDYLGNWKSTPWKDTISLPELPYDYDFDIDEIVMRDHFNHPDIITGNDNMRYSIMNILAYVLDRVINQYMIKYCRNNHSLYKDPNDPTKDYRPCKIIMKNEF